jgi:phosphatidylglycerol:prolipoprotein diacylglycerol transferase
LQGLFPELFHIGSFTIYSYGFFILLGVIVAYIFFWKNSRKYGLSSDKVSEMFLWCVVGVFGGGKLFFFFEDPVHYWSDPGDFFDNFGSGFVFYGSFIATVPILIWWFKKNKLPVWEMFDLIGIGGAFVHAFGKIGCFMAGCCHGKVCPKGSGVVFNNPKTSAEPIGVELYPVQLWDAGIIFLAIVCMLWLKKRKQFAGQLFLVYGLWYAVGRYITEYYRGDVERGFLFNGALSHSQFLAIIVFLVCLVVYIWRYRYVRSQRSKE